VALPVTSSAEAKSDSGSRAPRRYASRQVGRFPSITVSWPPTSGLLHSRIRCRPRTV